jgi:hypothetical protein|tara:strand:+ start:538 stop:1404 length:867 start_codon:yes stop_codon:yes gene_type:complete
MPLVGFKYPDGNVISLEDVASNKVDIGKMGTTLPTLLEMSNQRDADRKPSVTELISGTCESYLKRTADYFESPDEQAFALSGTKHHAMLEKSALSNNSQITEISLESNGITGTADLYDEDRKMLVDYKLSGSYKVAKALGVQVKHSFHPTEVYKKGGRWGKAGSPRRVKEFYIDSSKADLEDWGWQLNFYRYLLEKSGKEVNSMYIQATVRDGGLQVATSRGVDRKIYMIAVPFINDEHLENKFFRKRDALIKALEDKELPSKCTDTETWNGVKCESYCSVKDVCPYV